VDAAINSLITTTSSSSSPTTSLSTSTIPPVVSSPIPDTGQTKCYNNTTEITCPQPGEPFYGQDAQYGTNSQSYTNLGDGVIKDNVTGLEWQQATAPNTYTWQQAFNYCDALSLGGHSDWRLPTIKELSSIIHFGRNNPAIETIFFTPSPYDYLSSTACAYDTNLAWYISFANGYVYSTSKSSSRHVRAVRVSSGSYDDSQNLMDNGDGTVSDHETGLMWQKSPQQNAMSWADALAYCENLGLAEYTDWRMPNAKEQQSILNYSLNNPAIDTAFFPNFPPNQTYNNQWYWTSTSQHTFPSYARVVNIYYGGMDALDHEGPISVWAVRGRQGGSPTTTTTLQPSSTTTSEVSSTTTTSSVTSSTTTSMQPTTSSTSSSTTTSQASTTSSETITTSIVPTTTTTSTSGGHGGGGGGGSVSTTTSINTNPTTVPVTSTLITTTTTSLPPPECIADADCDEGVFCNGAEKCSNGSCVAGQNPCNQGQVCREETDTCWDKVSITATCMQKVIMMPLLREKKCPWLILFTAQEHHFMPGGSSTEVTGAVAGAQGVTIDNRRKAFSVGNLIFIPVCVERGASTGQWNITIKTDVTNASLEETIVTSLQVK
jgi:hypothetical protein